jgi:hypothetical protein
VPNLADTVYAPKPWGSNEERLVSESLAATQMPVEVIRAIRPPLPRVQLFPMRTGYGERRAFGIADVVEVDNRYPGARTDYAGMRSGPGYSGSSFPALNAF